MHLGGFFLLHETVSWVLCVPASREKAVLRCPAGTGWLWQPQKGQGSLGYSPGQTTVQRAPGWLSWDFVPANSFQPNCIVFLKKKKKRDTAPWPKTRISPLPRTPRTTSFIPAAKISKPNSCTMRSTSVVRSSIATATTPNIRNSGSSLCVWFSHGG